MDDGDLQAERPRDHATMVELVKTRIEQLEQRARTKRTAAADFRRVAELLALGIIRLRGNLKTLVAGSRAARGARRPRRREGAARTRRAATVTAAPPRGAGFDRGER
jgi:hypothetical protein